MISFKLDLYKSIITIRIVLHVHIIILSFRFVKDEKKVIIININSLIKLEVHKTHVSKMKTLKINYYFNLRTVLRVEECKLKYL